MVLVAADSMGCRSRRLGHFARGARESCVLAPDIAPALPAISDLGKVLYEVHLSRFLLRAGYPDSSIKKAVGTYVFFPM